jgi:hypothetical protein
MLKRLKVFGYAAALAGISMLTMGCSWGWGGAPFTWLWNTNVSSWTRIVGAILREELFS